jgi:hypothetical protein
MGKRMRIYDPANIWIIYEACDRQWKQGKMVTNCAKSIKQEKHYAKAGLAFYDQLKAKDDLDSDKARGIIDQQEYDLRLDFLKSIPKPGGRVFSSVLGGLVAKQQVLSKEANDKKESIWEI